MPESRKSDSDPNWRTGRADSNPNWRSREGENPFSRGDLSGARRDELYQRGLEEQQRLEETEGHRQLLKQMQEGSGSIEKDIASKSPTSDETSERILTFLKGDPSRSIPKGPESSRSTTDESKQVRFAEQETHTSQTASEENSLESLIKVLKPDHAEVLVEHIKTIQSLDEEIQQKKEEIKSKYLINDTNDTNAQERLMIQEKETALHEIRSKPFLQAATKRPWLIVQRLGNVTIQQERLRNFYNERLKELSHRESRENLSKTGEILQQLEQESTTFDLESWVDEIKNMRKRYTILSQGKYPNFLPDSQKLLEDVQKVAEKIKSTIKIRENLDQTSEFIQWFDQVGNTPGLKIEDTQINEISAIRHEHTTSSQGKDPGDASASQSLLERAKRLAEGMESTIETKIGENLDQTNKILQWFDLGATKLNLKSLAGKIENTKERYTTLSQEKGPNRLSASQELLEDAQKAADEIKIDRENCLKSYKENLLKAEQAKDLQQKRDKLEQRRNIIIEHLRKEYGTSNASECQQMILKGAAQEPTFLKTLAENLQDHISVFSLSGIETDYKLSDEDCKIFTDPIREEQYQDNLKRIGIIASETSSFPDSGEDTQIMLHAELESLRAILGIDKNRECNFESLLKKGIDENQEAGKELAETVYRQSLATLEKAKLIHNKYIEDYKKYFNAQKERATLLVQIHKCDLELIKEFSQIVQEIKDIDTNNALISQKLDTSEPRTSSETQETHLPSDQSNPTNIKKLQKRIRREEKFLQQLTEILAHD